MRRLLLPGLAALAAVVASALDATKTIAVGVIICSIHGGRDQKRVLRVRR